MSLVDLTNLNFPLIIKNVIFPCGLCCDKLIKNKSCDTENTYPTTTILGLDIVNPTNNANPPVIVPFPSGSRITPVLELSKINCRVSDLNITIFKQLNNNKNALLIRDSGKYYIIPRIGSVDWSATPSLSVFTIDLDININVPYGSGIGYGQFNLLSGFTPAGPFISYNPIFLYNIVLSNREWSPPLPLEKDSILFFTIRPTFSPASPGLIANIKNITFDIIKIE